MNEIAKIKKIYIDGWARTETFRNNFRLVKVLRLVDKIISTPQQRILDIGCGNGAFSVELGKRVKAEDIFGVDISPNAAKNAISNNVKIKALDIDEEDLPFASNYFDFIFCGNLIELVQDPDHLLTELNRVLKKGGYLIITFPNICAWASRIAVLLGFHPYYDCVSMKYNIGKLFMPITKEDSQGFVRLFSLYSFKQMSRVYGFKIFKIYGARANNMPKFISFIDGIISRVPSLAFQIIYVAIKKHEKN